MDTTAIHQAIGDLNRAFLADMEALPAEAWQQPSDCAGWTIAGAVIHLAQVAELLGDSLARGRAGDPGPPPLAAQEGVQTWRARRAERQQAALKQSPSELLAWYRRAYAAIDAELDAIPGADPSARGWHPVGPQPLSWVQDQWLFELALHDWDIRVALDSEAEVRPSVQAAFARTLPARLGRGFGGGDDPALAGLYHIQLEARPPLAFVVQVGNGGLTILAEEGAPSPDVMILTNPSAFALVMTNRRPVERFESVGRWQVGGDEARARGFAQAFKGY
jgi:uncharacterized protein (TIGR03083 family)